MAKKLNTVFFLLCGVISLTAGCGSEEKNETQSAFPSEQTSADSLANHPEGETWADIKIDYEGDYARQVAGLAQMYTASTGLTPPEFQRIRFVDVFSWGSVQVECLQAEGFQSRESQGGVVFEEKIPEDQEKALELATYKCSVQYPMDPRYTVNPPREAAEAEYERLVTKIKPCLENMGYTVPEPPSKITWLENVYSGRNDWDPWGNVVPEDPETLDEAYRKCPLHSPEIYNFED